MRIRVYQINPDLDPALTVTAIKLRFMPFDSLKGYSGRELPMREIYEIVFDGMVDCYDLDDVWIMLNEGNWHETPDHYDGRSCSVSDIIEVVDPEDADIVPGLYYVDDIGFRHTRWADD